MIALSSLLAFVLLFVITTRDRVVGTATLSSCDCVWPDKTHPTVQTCDSPPKMCGYCMDAMAFMYYGPENSATVACAVSGRNVDVCNRVATEVQVSSRHIPILSLSVM